MHIKIDVNTEIEIKKLTDLPKFKIFMESLNMKINKSQLARDLNVDRRTIDKYLNGYQPSNTRKRASKIDEYYNVIKLLLSDESPQKFYYKRVLWQYLKDNHGLDCADSTFRAYISRKPEFQQYFDSHRGRTNTKEAVRFETPQLNSASRLERKHKIYNQRWGNIICKCL